MPKRPTRRRFSHHRARRILRLVGMSHEEFRKLLNLKTGSAARPPHVSAWMNGTRDLPDAAVLLLKWIVERARTKRRMGA